MTLDTPISKIHKLRKPQREALERLGLRTVRDALLFVPYRYDSFDRITPVNKLRVGEKQAFRVRIASIETRRTRRRGLSLTEAVVEDASGPVRAVWFNQPYLPDMLPPGTEVLLYGKVDYKKSGPQLSSPKFEKLEDDADAKVDGHITPVYSASAGISTRTILAIVRKCLPLVRAIEDTLPEELLKRQGLVPLSDALQELHLPTTREALAVARERMAFEELYELQLTALTKRERWRAGGGENITLSPEHEAAFRDALPFSLTGAQERVWSDIQADLSSGAPMYRLLQGDVGAGKTLVAGLALLATAQQGAQAVLMAPTDLLAKQHFATLKKYLAPFLGEISIGLFTRTRQSIHSGSQKTLSGDTQDHDCSKAVFLEALADGSVDIVVGTHALIQGVVQFDHLALAVIDEQHRFGVEQREVLRRAGGTRSPHLLSMTATPIPRTLALAVYADLDVSVLDELPPGRTPIATRIVSPRGAKVAEQFMRQQIDKGHQLFLVCPLIQDSDDETLAKVPSAEETFERLANGLFSDVRLALLHGKLTQEEKDAVMSAFVAGELDAVVSTTVVEVGVDVPNATVMAIYGAERFGLAQLHQLRGRVGRGEHASSCLAFVTRSGRPAERLNVFESSTDGFELAQKDLEQRGPGELAGVAQSGLPDLRMASLMDTALLARVQEEARSHLLATAR